jgi:hypothetical protein
MESTFQDEQITANDRAADLRFPIPQKAKWRRLQGAWYTTEVGENMRNRRISYPCPSILVAKKAN